MFGKNNEARVEIIDFAKEQQRRERKQKREQKVREILDWANRNPMIAMALVSATTGAVAFAVKTTAKQIKLNKEKDLKDLYCYDRSLGHYWRLKRELSNSEWVEIDKRKRNGERLADILDELKVLK